VRRDLLDRRARQREPEELTPRPAFQQITVERTPGLPGDSRSDRDQRRIRVGKFVISRETAPVAFTVFAVALDGGQVAGPRISAL
jgi:hypothetical protein